MPNESLPGLDLPRVARFFAGHVAGGAGPLRARLLSGGRSNITYLVESDDGGRWVVRRPPLGHVLPTAHDMAREFRVLSALADTDVPTPRPFALCEDPAVNGAPFYVMEYVPGVIVEGPLPGGFAATAAERARLGAAVVDALARLHAVDPASVGLGGFGKPDGYLRRQVERWIQQWERSKTRELALVADLARRLAAAIPESPRATIVHGDYRLGNMVLDAGDPGRVLAILDWEMATLGDPLADLGWLLIYWGERGDPVDWLEFGGGVGTTAQEGFPTRAQLVARYEACAGISAAAIDFYRALAFFKLAVIAEGIHARFLQGKTVGEGFTGFNAADRLLEHADAIARASADPRLRG